MEPFVLLAVVWILIFVGLVGTILPGLPGVGLVFGGIFLYALYFGMDSIGSTTLILLGVATLFSFLIDFLASLYGAARFGASRAGMWGSAIGGVVGFLVLNLPGIFLGVFAGAVAGEHFVAKKSMPEAVRAGVGSILGFLAGTVIKFVLAIGMVVVFVVKVWL